MTKNKENKEKELVEGKDYKFVSEEKKFWDDLRERTEKAIKIGRRQDEVDNAVLEFINKKLEGIKE